ncbi:MAG: restriction endonuclease subunit S, partial [Balneolaceae bacterium]|nr:restriction endonuclease subunit S [Balneolaceae bacterium]
MNLTDLLDEFNVVIDTSKGLTELRSLILGLAVRGKLVPQDPNDEPASVLLKKIEEERQYQYDEGLIRKPKVFGEVTPKDSLKNLPNNWKQERLGNLTTVITKGSTPTTYGFQ